MKITDKFNIPKYVRDTGLKLVESGYEAHLVGGSVRDLILGKHPNDFDIATNAYPEEIEKMFEKSIPTGAQFGTILVLVEDEDGETREIEITTYRSESDYQGGRWPTKVEFTKTIQEDMARRDFTINAMAIRLDQDGYQPEDIIDPYGGQEDLRNGIIRAVGDPLERLTEDGLRSIRACRFAANLGFQIEEKTFEAIKQTLTIIDNISKERVRDELMKLLLKSHKPSIGLEYMRKSGVLELILPELLEGIDIVQPQYHSTDVYSHTLATVDAAEDSVKLAALLHDIGKPRTKSEDEHGVHFYGHDKVGAEMAEEIMERLKFSRAEITRVATLVRNHMFYYPAGEWRKEIFGADFAEKTTEGSITELWLMRHGATDYSQEGRISGQSDIGLNEEGRNTVLEISRELAGSEEKPEFLYSSPLKRAVQTAEIISQELNLEIKLSDRLKERNFGEFENLTWGEFETKFPQLANHPDNSAQRQDYLPAGESISQVESRAMIAAFEIIKSHIGSRVLVVTHNGIIRVLLKHLKELIVNYENFDEIMEPEAGQILKLKIDNTQLDPHFLTDAQLEKIADGSESLGGYPGGWSDGAVRRFLKKVAEQPESGSGDNLDMSLVDDLFKLRIADAIGNPKAAFNPKEIHLLAERISEVQQQEMALKVTDLDISGKDLQEKLGLQPGPDIGKILNHLLEIVIDDPTQNDPERLLELAREFLG